MNKAISDLSLTEVEKYKVNCLLRQRTNDLSVSSEDPAATDYIEAIIRGIICELLLSGKIKWRRAFKIRLGING